mmetsp:Transcript_10752/g.31782  ORF Transcript_10752/g.31782 Transcript_10752/m.31782 type:complete len:220 (-) Transcript_10752:88-747(-)
MAVYAKAMALPEDALVEDSTFHISPFLQRSTSTSSGKSPFSSSLSVASTRDDGSGFSERHPSESPPQTWRQPGQEGFQRAQSGDSEVLVSLLHTILLQGAGSGVPASTAPPSRMAEPCELRKPVGVTELNSLKDRLAASLRPGRGGVRASASEDPDVAELMSLKQKLAGALDGSPLGTPQSVASRSPGASFHEPAWLPAPRSPATSAMLYNGVAYIARR